jgi:hypothetical protein
VGTTFLPERVPVAIFEKIQVFENNEKVVELV